MTTIKLDSKLGGPAALAIEELVTPLYSRPGLRLVAIVELAAVERTQPAPDEDKDASVKIQIKHLEVARGDHEPYIRQALDALHRLRTAQGTLDGELLPQLSDRTIEMTAGSIVDVEAARLHVVCDQWAAYIRKVLNSDATAPQLREELRTVAKGLDGALRWADGRGGVA